MHHPCSENLTTTCFQSKKAVRDVKVHSIERHFDSQNDTRHWYDQSSKHHSTSRLAATYLDDRAPASAAPTRSSNVTARKSSPDLSHARTEEHCREQTDSFYTTEVRGCVGVLASTGLSIASPLIFLGRFGCETVTTDHIKNTQNEPSGSGQSDETKPAQTEGQCIAILDSPETATRLLEASPLRVQIPLSREQSDDSEEATNDMTCYITPSSSPSSSSSSESIEEITGVENPYSAPFTIDTSDARVKDMMASGAPGNHIADCFTMHRRSKHGVDPEERRKRVKQAQKWSERMGAASLMGLWSSRDELHGTRRENP